VAQSGIVQSAERRVQSKDGPLSALCTLRSAPPVGQEGFRDGTRSVWLREPSGKIFRPTPKQNQFFRALRSPKYSKVCMIGGAGAGKTTAACAALLLYMHECPNSTWLVGRLNYRGLVNVTWRVLRQMCPKESVLYASDSQQDLRLVLKNGAVLLGWNLAQWERFQGLTLAGALIDEATELQDKMIFDALALRIRDPNGPNKLWTACMPNGRDWVWRTFFADPPEGFFGMRATSFDNPHLADSYIPDLKRQLSPEMYARFVEAEFTTLSGLVHYPWDEATHLVDDFEIPKHWPRFLALDPGFHQDPAACLFGACDEFGNLFLYDEYYETGKVIREQAAVILAKMYPNRFEWRVVDPAAVRRTEDTGRTHIDLYAEAGLHLVEAPRARVEVGIAAVNQTLLPDEEHFHPLSGYNPAPHLFVFRSLKNFRDEIGGWTYDPRGRPRERNDHLMAALRYMILRRPHAAARPTKAIRENGWKAFLEWDDAQPEAPLPVIGV
jgi:hypothetical protein